MSPVSRSAMSGIAPRLARAHAAELEYQRRKADVRRRGVLPIDIAIEEMIRAMRMMARHTATMMRRWRAMPEHSQSGEQAQQ